MCKPKYEGERAEAFLSLFEKDETLQKIARYRYVEGMTLEGVGMMVGYSTRQVQRLIEKIEERIAVTCIDCIHYAVCLEWQEIEDNARKQSHTIEEDFLRMEHHKDCGHFRKESEVQGE